MVSKPETLVLIGTRKGLFILESVSKRKNWKLRGPYLEGRAVYHAVMDPRNGRLVATWNSVPFGSTIQLSDDMGSTWRSSRLGPKFPEASKIALRNIWNICPGPPDQTGVLYCGTDPAGLFRSSDGGESWEPVNSVLNHPTRKVLNKMFPGWDESGGGMALHSINWDRRNTRRWYFAVSTGGVYRSDDDGETWEPKNRGVAAGFLPERYPMVGQCVHALVPDSKREGVVYIQNHGGEFRGEVAGGAHVTANAGETWKDVSRELPSQYGFALASHPHKAGAFYVFPLEHETRLAIDGRPAVYRTEDYGKSWTRCDDGLPKQDAYMEVYREGMSTDQSEPVGVYFGTNTGHVFFSGDEGRTWAPIAQLLPSVLSVEAYTLTL
jgi:photosystem II stability/assembly factor-like uncharacterized protein